MRLFVLGAAAALLLAAGCDALAGPGESIADYPAYPSGAELVAAADVIVHGTALDARDDTLYPDPPTGTDPARNPQAGVPENEREASGVAVTITRVKVTEVLKGDVRAGDVIEVSQLRGEQNTTDLAEDAEYALLLAGFGAGRPFSPVNPTQGVYEVRDGELRKVTRGQAPPFGTLADLKVAAA